MSTMDGLSRDELLQLKKDALETRTVLVIRGWTPGALIHFQNLDSTDGPVCMTGAAGCASEKKGFINWVRKWMVGRPDNYEWLPKSKVLLRVLAEVGDGKFRSYPHSHYTSHLGAVSTIISINDGFLNGSKDALAWVDAALEQIDQHLAAMEPVKESKPEVQSAEPLMYRLFSEEEEKEEELA
jgi:hypothetical protein